LSVLKGRLNCSRLISDLSHFYPGIFLLRKDQGKSEEEEDEDSRKIHRREEETAKMIARDEPRDMQVDDEEMANLAKVLIMKRKNDDGEECDPGRRESCGNGRICIEIGVTNGTDNKEERGGGRCLGKMIKYQHS
jgi:hypothetical protein